MNDSNIIYILSAPDTYAEAQARGVYEVESLRTEGFIHASPAHQLTRVANKYYAANPELHILHVDTTKVEAQILWEPIANGDLYPHIYGPLNLDAIVQVETVQRLDDGTYRIELSV